MSSFEGENMQTKYVLSYRIDSYFHYYKLAIEIHENGHSDITIEHKIKIQKLIEYKLGSKVIKIDPDKEDCGIFRTINEIFRHIKQPTKKEK